MLEHGEQESHRGKSQSTEYTVTALYLRHNQLKQKEVTTMFEIKEVANVEATGSLIGSAISCAGTWGAVFLLCGALAC